MARKVDKEVLKGFIEEAKGYLPRIRKGIEAYKSDPGKSQELEEAHRHMHTIKGASSMVGLSALSHMAYDLEEILSAVISGKLALEDDSASLVCAAIDQIGLFLEGTRSGKLDEKPITDEVARICRVVRGLPEGAAGFEETVEEHSPASTTASQDDTQPTSPALLKPKPQDEISPELIEVFTIEAEDHLRNICLHLASLEKDPQDREVIQDLRRSVHTLKGAAGAVGLGIVAQVSHRMEDLLDSLDEGSQAVDSGMLDLLYASTDTLEDITRGEVKEGALTDRLEELYAQYERHLNIPSSKDVPARKIEPLGEEMILNLAGFSPGDSRDGALPTTERDTAPLMQRIGEVVRVPLERLDDLVRLVSELVINRTAFEQHMNDFVQEVEELQLSSERLRRVSMNLESKYEVSALGKPSVMFDAVAANAPNPAEAFSFRGFDELEFDRYTEFHLLSRELVETASDVRTVENELVTLIGDFDSILNRQSRLSSEIQDKLMRTRMVPLATLATRLHRAVRVLAREQGKLVELVIEGERIEIDKSVLDDMVDPLLHLLRNAVDHGIEPPALRQVMGKPERGQILLKAYHQGNQVVIQVSDNGAGMEPQILRAAAVAGGHVSEVEAPLLSEDELHSLVFLPGFSTAVEVSEVSGRGVGLDIVKTNVNKLKGSVSLESTPGQGTTFTIRLPMTMAVMRALLVKAHGENFAIPLNIVTNILRLERDEIERIGQDPVVRVEDTVYPLLRLGEVLDLKQLPDESLPRLPVLILDIGEKQIALIVDQLLGGREIVIKSLGSHLRRVHGIAGATLMGDGTVVLILNPSELVHEAPQPEERSGKEIPAFTTLREVYSVMIVDDSLSVRRVVSNLIRSAGWFPIAARDGQEALEILQGSTQPPDLILVDIEMPRMNGYELMSTLKAHETFHDIPLVVLTSRAGEKHRRRAIEIGAADYVVKPYNDERLLSTIRQLVLESRRVVSA